jgi:hypothetical protein
LMAGLLEQMFTAPYRAMEAQAPKAPSSMGVLGDIHNAIDPVQAMGGYGGLLAMALPPGAPKGWTVKTTREHPMMGTREVSIYDANGEWKGLRSAARGTDEQILAEWFAPKTPYRRKPTRPDPIEITDNPTNAPEVAWNSRDLQDSASPTLQTIMKDYGRGTGTVRQGYVNLSGLPKEKLAGGKTGYAWDELQHSRSAPPPIKIRINKNGSTSILDGNHRISYWRERGFDEAPAWIIDERVKK